MSVLSGNLATAQQHQHQTYAATTSHTMCNWKAAGNCALLRIAATSMTEMNFRTVSGLSMYFQS